MLGGEFRLGGGFDRKGFYGSEFLVFYYYPEVVFAVQAEPMDPRRADALIFRFWHGPAVAGGAGEFFKVDERDAFMFGFRGAEATGLNGFFRTIRVAAHMTAFAGELLDGLRFAFFLGFAFVAADNLMVGAVAVAIDTRHAGGNVDILVVEPMFCFGWIDILVGMAEVAAILGHFADDIKEYPLFTVEPAHIVGYFDIVIHEGVIEIIDLSGDFSQTGRGRGNPAIVFAQALESRFGLVLLWVGIMTGETINFENPRSFDIFRAVRRFIKFFAVITAGHVATKLNAHFPGRNAHIDGFMRPFPASPGER